MSEVRARGQGSVMDVIEHVERKRGRPTFNRSERRRLESRKFGKKQGWVSGTQEKADELQRVRKDRIRKRRREKEARRGNRK